MLHSTESRNVSYIYHFFVIEKMSLRQDEIGFAGQIWPVSRSWETPFSSNPRCSTAGISQSHVQYLVWICNVSNRRERPRIAPLMLTLQTAGFLLIVLTNRVKTLLLLSGRKIYFWRYAYV